MGVRQKILIVDDKPENLFALEKILDSTGAEIVGAASGNDALIASLNHEFALAILDVQMPGMDGYELAELLRDEERTRHLPIIFLSAVYSDEHHIFKGYEAGAVDFITKPYHPAVLTGKVRVFLELDRQRMERSQHLALMKTLVRVSADVLAQDSIEGLLRRVVDASRELTGARMSTSGHDYRDGEFHVGATSRAEGVLSCPSGGNASVPRGGVYLEVVRSRQPLRLTDEQLRNHPLWWGLPEGHTSLRGFLGVPLFDARGEASGLIVVSDKEEGEFIFEDESLLVQLAALASLGLQHLEAGNALRRSRDELEVRVQERTAELTKANETLKAEVEHRKKIEEELRLDEARFEALYELSQMSDAPVKEMMDYVLEHQVKLTESKIGWVGFINEDETMYTNHAWSKLVLPKCCLREKPVSFLIKEGGLWAEAIRKRKVVIINDYNDPHPARRDCPEGHVRILRFMTVPLFDGEKIVAMATVGNKEEPYDPSDAMQVSLLLDGVWKLLKRKQADEERKRYTVQLEQSNRELEDFAFVASHDLQEPLRKMQTFANLLMEMYRGSLDETGWDYLKRIRQSATRMQDLIQYLLKYSRITTHPEPLVPVDLKLAVEDVITDLAILMEETDGCVEVKNLPTLEADAVQMRQLFQNLIGNALKYCVENKPVIKIYQGPHCSNGTYEIYVEDNGIGFDEIYLDRIFRPFQRLHGKKSRYQGIGMGLAICRKIVERHGGSITARSKPGEGTTFIVTLPEKQLRLEALH